MRIARFPHKPVSATFGRRVAAVAALALAAPVLGAGIAGATGLQAAQPKPVQTSTFSVQPSRATELDRRPAFVFAALAGSKIRDHIALVNSQTKPVTLSVYASDAFNSEAGGYDLLAANQKPKDVGSWITLPKRLFTVPARGRVIVPFTLNVPKNASPGDHAGGIVASLPVANSKRVNGVVVDQRVGTRVYMTVQGAATPKLEVTNVKASYDGTLNPVGQGSVRVTYTVRNAGNVRLGAKQSVTVKGIIGTSATATPADLPELLPGSSVEQSAVVTGVWPTVRIKTTVTLQAITASPLATSKIPDASASVTGWAIPWTLLALIALLIVGYFVDRRRRARRRLSPPELPSTPLDTDREVSVS